MSTSSQTVPRLSETPAFKRLAMAIDPKIPAEFASNLLHDFYTTARVLTVATARHALLGTTDGGEVDAGFEIPAGEIGRILDELRDGAR